jgi:hypothetical protein
VRTGYLALEAGTMSPPTTETPGLKDEKATKQTAMHSRPGCLLQASDLSISILANLSRTIHGYVRRRSTVTRATFSPTLLTVVAFDNILFVNFFPQSMSKHISDLWPALVSILGQEPRGRSTTTLRRPRIYTLRTPEGMLSVRNRV